MIGRIRPDRAELGLLVLLLLMAFAPLALLAYRALVDDSIWPGIDASVVSQDEWQYLNWIRDASEHVLISNHYVAEDTERSYLHPLVLISAAFAKLGLSPAVAYLLWKPVAVVALFAATLVYVRRLVSDAPARWIALALALFFFPPVALIAGEGSARLGDPIPLTVVSEGIWSGNSLWGYYFSALAVAATVGAFLAYERDRTAGRLSAWPALLALLAAWLQPWQGALVIGVVVGAELLLRALAPAARRPRAAPLLTVLAAAAAPLVYYFVLSRVDPSWGTANDSYRFLDPPAWAVAATLAPLALPALLAYRRRPADFQEAALLVWPPAALGLFALIAILDVGHYAPHSLRGIAIPLAILAVTGVASLGLRWTGEAALAVAAVAVLVLTLPATLDRMSDAERRINDPGSSLYLEQGERDALDYLDDDPRPGSVYAPSSMGQLVPAETGRHTNVGHLTWTPDYLKRQLFTDLLFRDALKPRVARSLVTSSGSPFLLAGCDYDEDLAPLLRPLLASVRRFGCATVYEIRPSTLRASG